MKKILLFIAVLVFPFIVNASSISSIDMDIKLSENGTAHIIETWDARVTSGTEGWHPYYNIGKSEIKVTSARMDNQEFEIVEHWRENSNLSDKALKAGIYKPDSEEVDIVFGISNYGNHKYVIEYDITNFVSNLSDSDMIYWTLFPYDFSAEPDNVTIKISGPYEYPDTLDVWGFGMYGAPCYVNNGSIYMTSDGRISSSEYLTLLAKFPKGTFNTTSVYDDDFDYYLNMAQEGSTEYVVEPIRKASIFEKIMSVFGTLFSIAIFFAVAIFASKSTKNNKYNFGKDGKKLGEVPTFRDIPCNKDLFYAYWIAENYNLNKNKTDFLGSLLLKWIKDENVSIEKAEIKKLLSTKEETVIIFKRKPENANIKEQQIYDYMNNASKDGKLEKDEFKKWCRDNYSKILNWFDDTLDFERDDLVTKDLVVKEQLESGKIFKYKYNQYVIGDKVKEEAKKMKGLKQFLEEFSRINEKEPIEVKLWNEYLMYAQIFGIAKEVMKQFKNLYPEVLKDMESYNYNYDTFVFVNSFYTEGVSAASSARSAAQSYSSGGGGFSSGGGGGGSFGGGGGGGGFR